MQILDKGCIELLNYMGDDNTIVAAARVSHLGESKGTEQDSKLIAYLLKHKHTSPFEQVEFQFLVRCPLFVRSQWHRHRTWSYNETSRRYTSEYIDFYVPDSLHEQSTKDKQARGKRVEGDKYLIEQIEKHANLSFEFYNLMLASGVCREQARMVLPQNMYTSFYAKTDLHNLLHFIELRNSPHAQYEIRVYAQAIEKLIQPIVPIAYQCWKELIVEQVEREEEDDD